MSHALLLPLRARRAAAVLAAPVLAAVAAPAPAVADENPYTVTYAARVCDEYTDVTANLARNDIMESLRDLGADTLYESGEAIKVSKEDHGQPNCRPLVGWRFTLGTGIGAKVTGPWGALSTVTAVRDEHRHAESTPELDAAGNAVGTATVKGAVTVELTADQADRAQNATRSGCRAARHRPGAVRPYPGQYGFAALRCAVDNLNGDNVEWIAYPTGGRHVFCYAYYVTPPPTSGTIVITKAVQPLDAGAPPSGTFRFDGNVSYTDDNTFSLTASVPQPGSISFVRGGVGADDPPWVVRELAQAGWLLTSLTCTSSSGASATASAGPRPRSAWPRATRSTARTPTSRPPRPAACPAQDLEQRDRHVPLRRPDASGETRSYTLTTACRGSRRSSTRGSPRRGATRSPRRRQAGQPRLEPRLRELRRADARAWRADHGGRRHRGRRRSAPSSTSLHCSARSSSAPSPAAVSAASATRSSCRRRQPTRSTSPSPRRRRGRTRR